MFRNKCRLGLINFGKEISLALLSFSKIESYFTEIKTGEPGTTHRAGLDVCAGQEEERQLSLCRGMFS